MLYGLSLCLVLHPWQIDKLEKQPENDHGKAQNLPHVDRAHEVTDLEVRFSEKLAKDPEYSIHDKKNCKDIPFPLFPVFINPKNSEKQNTFKKGFIELRGVS